MEKRYDFARCEREAQVFWEEKGVYRFDPEGDGEIYSIDTPPPTVSGKLHVGHLFSYAQAEMIARFQRMQGKNVYYPFGFDDNGLPTERLVEQEHRVRGRDLPRGEFTALCRDTAASYEAQYRALWQSLGISADWSLQYETGSAETAALSQRLFLELAAAGRAYCREAPVLWCTQCGTSIAQAELETQNRESAFHTLRFSCGGETLPVATTRPELLFGCVCLFVHPTDERYRRFVGKRAVLPLYGLEVPVYEDEKADPEKGTGAVMCCTYGDSTDAQWCEERGFAYRRVLEPDGRLADCVPHLAGLSVAQARGEILRLLSEQGFLLSTEPVTHAVAVHERCGTEVELLPSRQWYIDVLREKEALLRAAEGVRWYPPQMKSRYTDWVENLKWDWCVSRGRYHGVPVPVWYCKSCGAPAFPPAEGLPVDPREQTYPGPACGCGGTEFLPETSVLDTWATSSVTPLLHRERGAAFARQDGKPLFPMSLRAQAHEIIRTWTFYSITRSLYHTGALPWQDVMVSGFVLAKKGEKLSKSKSGGAFDPATLIREHSADALRGWAANARLGTDTFFSPADLNPEKRLLTKLWNAARFCQPLLEDFTPSDREAAALLPTDRWILARAGDAMRKAAELLSRYEVGQARHEIDDFFWKDFCDSYLELAKERLYEGTGEVRTAAQSALYRALLTVLQLYAPYAPHITETVYREIFQHKETAVSLHLTRWPKPQAADAAEEELLRFGESLKENLSQMRGEKTAGGLSLRAALAVFSIRTDSALLPLFRDSERDLLACAHAEKICYLNQ